MKFSTYLFEVYYLIQDFKFVIEKKICPVLKQIKYLDKGKNSSNISSCATHISSVTTPFLKRELNLELKSGWNFFFEGKFFSFSFLLWKTLFSLPWSWPTSSSSRSQSPRRSTSTTPFLLCGCWKASPQIHFSVYIFSAPPSFSKVSPPPRILGLMLAI